MLAIGTEKTTWRSKCLVPTPQIRSGNEIRHSPLLTIFDLDVFTIFYVDVSMHTCTMEAIQIKATAHSVFPGRLCTLCGLRQSRRCMADSAPHTPQLALAPPPSMVQTGYTPPTHRFSVYTEVYTVVKCHIQVVELAWATSRCSFPPIAWVRG